MVYLVGVGPGSSKNTTPQATLALESSQVIIGHNDSIKFVKRLILGKEVIHIENNPLERSRVAVEKVQIGQNVAIVSAGDPGTYAIASAFLTYLRDNNITLDVKVIPGLTIASYAAAKLGLPLGGNYATISLSDQVQSWANKRKKLELAAGADFVLVIYNLISRQGNQRIQQALNLISHYRGADTPIGLVTGSDTPEEKVVVTTLEEINLDEIGIDTLAIIGNSKTFVLDGKMVTNL